MVLDSTTDAAVTAWLAGEGNQADHTLLVGFDSAWTAANTGGLAGVLREEDGRCRELGLPDATNFENATVRIASWREACRPRRTVILIDQPTIVRNAAGQRPVEHLIASPVSRRRGGMQPANTGRLGMFDADAPIWTFLARVGGTLDPLDCEHADRVIVETYPTLALIALGWLREDVRPCGRLPKYNPARPTFLLDDWRGVCGRLAEALEHFGLVDIPHWLRQQEQRDARPRKADQDGVDSCLCLLMAFHLEAKLSCLRVGNRESGLTVAPTARRFGSNSQRGARRRAESPQIGSYESALSADLPHGRVIIRRTSGHA